VATVTPVTRTGRRGGRPSSAYVPSSGCGSAAVDRRTRWASGTGPPAGWWPVARCRSPGRGRRSACSRPRSSCRSTAAAGSGERWRRRGIRRAAVTEPELNVVETFTVESNHKIRQVMAALAFTEVADWVVWQLPV
jgi:hypothetical protein